MAYCQLAAWGRQSGRSYSLVQTRWVEPATAVNILPANNRGRWRCAHDSATAEADIAEPPLRPRTMKWQTTWKEVRGKSGNGGSSPQCEVCWLYLHSQWLVQRLGRRRAQENVFSGKNKIYRLRTRRRTNLSRRLRRSQGAKAPARPRWIILVARVSCRSGRWTRLRVYPLFFQN